MTNPHRYNLDVKIEPERGEIVVEGKVSIALSNPEQKNFSFDIHEIFKIDNLTIEGNKAKYSTEKNKSTPTSPASKKVMIEIPESIDQKKIKMVIRYLGKLKDIPEFGSFENQKLGLDDQINSRMVELACYSCWYPFFEFGLRFDVDLELTLPSDWECVCSGKNVNTWKDSKNVITRWTSRDDTDIVIVASPELRRRTIDTLSGNIDIYFTRLPEKFVSKEVREIERTLTLYSELLGNPINSELSVKHVYSPKNKGQGGFSRPGLIVTSEGRILDALTQNPDISFLRGNAHEIAHFWWDFGKGQGDWINETFAEYFSLIAVQKISSVEKFKEYIKEYDKYVAQLPDDAPSLSEVPLRNDEIGYVIRYYKGALMLDYFRNLLGDETFFEFCRDFYHTFHKTRIGTSEFRSFWSERLGKHNDELEYWLTAKGELPKDK